MKDLIDRQAAIDGFYNVKVHEEDCTEYDIGYNDGIDYAISKLSVMPSAQPEIVKTILEEGYTGQEVRFRIGGRLFAVRELAQ